MANKKEEIVETKIEEPTNVDLLAQKDERINQLTNQVIQLSNEINKKQEELETYKLFYSAFMYGRASVIGEQKEK